MNTKKGQFEPAEVGKLNEKHFSITVQWKESKKHFFTSGDWKNHEWFLESPQVKIMFLLSWNKLSNIITVHS
jgi:hypothetical protein